MPTTVRRKLLLAADGTAPPLASLLAALDSSWHVHVTRAPSELASASTNDCIVLVHTPPHLDALARLEQLHTPWGAPQAPVVVLASCGDHSLRRAALRAGATEFGELAGLTGEGLLTLLESAQDRRAAGSGPGREADSGFPRRLLNRLLMFAGLLATDGTLLEANAAPLAAAGITLADVRGKKLWDCYWFDYDDGVRAQIREAVARAARGELVRYDAAIRMANDSRMIIDLQIAPLVDERGVVTHLVPSAVDITERAQVAEAWRASEQRYRTLFESIDEGFAIIEVLFDESGRATNYKILETNAAFERHTGVADSTGKTMREIVPELDESWFRLFGEVVTSGRAIRFENHAPELGRWFDVYACRAGGPESRQVALVFNDITERKLSRRALQESEARYKSLFDHLTEEVHLWEVERDQQGAIQRWTLVDANPSALASWQKTLDEVRGKTPDEIFGPGESERQLPVVRKIMTEGVPYSYDDYLPALQKHFRLASIPLGTRFMTTGADITSSQAERRLLDAVLEAAPVGIMVADARGKLLRVNPANERLWGNALGSDDLDKCAWKGWWADGSERHGKQLLLREWAMSRALRGEVAQGDIVEIEPFDQPGTRKTILNSGAPVRDRAGTIIGGVVAQMDITARVEAERAMAESEARFRTLADNMSQLAWMADEAGNIFWFNRRWYEYTGTTADRAVGESWSRVFHPDEWPRVEARFRKAISSQTAWEDTFRLRSKSGEYRWFLSRAMPVFDERGSVARWFGTNTDVEEQRRQAAALQKAVQVRETFLQIAAHELRTPLTALSLQLESLKRLLIKQGPDPRCLSKLEKSTRQVERLSKLIEDLLSVSRIASGRLHLEVERLELKSLARECIERLSEFALRSGCHIRLFASGSAPGRWDRSRIEQVLTNLLTNAIKYAPGQPIDVLIERQGEFVEVRVVDRGIGISPENQQRIFGRFERAVSSDHYGGLGLGLYITREIVQAHGGSIDVKSAPGKGTTFVVRLPLEARVRAEVERSLNATR